MLNLIRVSEFLGSRPHGFLIFNCNIIANNTLTGVVKFRNSAPTQWSLSDSSQADSVIPTWAFIINGEFGRSIDNYEDIIKAVNEYQREVASMFNNDHPVLSISKTGEVRQAADSLHSTKPSSVFDQMFQIGRDLSAQRWMLANKKTIIFDGYQQGEDSKCIWGTLRIHRTDLGLVGANDYERYSWKVFIDVDLKLYIGAQHVQTAQDVVSYIARNLETDLAPATAEDQITALRAVFSPAFDEREGALAEGTRIHEKVAIMEDHMSKVVDMSGLTDEQQAAYREAFHEGWLAKETQVAMTFKSIVGDQDGN